MESRNVNTKRSEDEVAILQRKLDSKVQALLILSKVLETCQTERDQLKVAVETLQRQMRHLGLNAGKKEIVSDPNSSLVTELLEKQQMLQKEVSELRTKLIESQGDVRVLRRQLSLNQNSEKVFKSQDQQTDLVTKLEQIQTKCKQLEADIQSVIDEKEEIITQRDAYRCKAHRLNHQLLTLLKGSHSIDLDSIVLENRYLHERLEQAQEEKNLAQQYAAKYKTMLDLKRQKPIVPVLKSSGGSMNSSMILSYSQVRQWLGNGPTLALEGPMPNNQEDLKALCRGLLDSLADKSLALNHQKKANRILAERLTELEQRLNTLSQENTEKRLAPPFPSLALLAHYNGADVDKFEPDAEDTELPSQHSAISHAASSPTSPSDNNDELPASLRQLIDDALANLNNERPLES